MLRGTKTRVIRKGNRSQVEIFNKVRYASDHELGGKSATHTIKKPFVRGGAQYVITGGQITARPFMIPSRYVLNTPKRLIQDKMKQLGWK